MNKHTCKDWFEYYKCVKANRLVNQTNVEYCMKMFIFTPSLSPPSQKYFFIIAPSVSLGTVCFFIIIFTHLTENFMAIFSVIPGIKLPPPQQEKKFE